MRAPYGLHGSPLTLLLELALITGAKPIGRECYLSDSPLVTDERNVPSSPTKFERVAVIDWWSLLDQF